MFMLKTQLLIRGQGARGCSGRINDDEGRGHERQRHDHVHDGFDGAWCGQSRHGNDNVDSTSTINGNKRGRRDARDAAVPNARSGNGSRALASAAMLTFMASVLPMAAGGQCAFTQECFQSKADSECIPALRGEGDQASALQSFPMNASHGFGVTHDKVWDGSVQDSATGLCNSGGIPDAQGRCMVDFVAPKGLSDVAPIICPQYQDDGCCTWQQNYALYSNFQTLVDSFGSTTGCLACAVNLVNFWCALICSPEQGSFVQIHDPPFAQRTDDLTGGSALVLQSDVTVEGDLACRIYESCKNVAIVGETTAMQSGLGLLKFQMQTGAVGHGEYFFLSFVNVNTGTARRNRVSHDDIQLESRTESASSASSGMELGTRASSALDLETLSCDSFYDPGSSTVPFPFPAKQEHLISCRCDYCAAACTGGGSIDVDVSNERPIPVLDGFGFVLVGSVYAAVVACSLAVLCWRISPSGHNVIHRKATSKTRSNNSNGQVRDFFAYY